MNIFIFKPITVLLLLAMLFGIVGCEKIEPNGETDFCLFANAENFHETAPFINEHLSSLPKNWSDERKLQSLINWLNSQSCIISATLEQEKAKNSNVPTTRSTPLEPPRGVITIRFDEDGVTEDILLEVGPRYPYTSDLWVATGYRYMKPREVRLATQLSTVSTVYDFINSFDFEVLWLHNMWFSSTTHSRDYVLENLVKKENYVATIGTIPGGQTFTPTFHSLENKDYQADWLRFMADYNLFETNSSTQITFLVPKGKEIEWIKKFLADYEFITSADFNWGYKSM
ncbi:MAG: hypothetical protein LBI82_01115 [Dysgonamonadaceae bacterium]|jgi:hypothetical protein|nr:hypothetical protein [Dysgonamonadaceae bacterium]